MHRDRPGSMLLRERLLSEHWSYMDRFAEEMIARGPLFEPDQQNEAVLLGSVHVLERPDPAAAWAFAFEEPNYRAGVYRDVFVRRWHNLLGRTMWQYPGGREGGRRYLVLGLLESPVGSNVEVPEDARGDLIAFGPLVSDDGRTRLGTAALVRAVDSAAALEVLGPERFAAVEVYAWRFGGRP